MLIFDWHLDLAWNALEWNRDLRLPVADIRRREIDRGNTGPGRGTNTVSLPALREGNFAVVSATLLARHDRDWRPLGFIPKSGYDSAEASNAMGLAQLAYYRALERTGQVRILTDWRALEAHVAEWQKQESGARNQESERNRLTPDSWLLTPASPPLGFIISMEGADPILSAADVGEWWAAGLRIVSLSHYGNARYAHGTGTPGPLNEQGPALLRAMEQVGMILDVTHLADEAMDQAFDAFGRTVIASHHNCRALVDRQRQLRDSDIKKIVSRGGVIGASCDAWMLDPDCGQGPGKVRRVATLESVADHIDHVCQLAGSAKHSAIGSDLDGGFGTEQSPANLDTIADLQKLPAIFESRGYSGEDIAGIMHGNWLDLMRAQLVREGDMIGIPLLLLLVMPAEEPPKPKFPLGRETTYVTGPLDKDGYVDYEAALNERLGKGVTPQTNAVVMFWKAIGPRPNGTDRMPTEYFKALGIHEPPDDGDYLRPLTDVLKLDPNKLDAILDKLSRARQRPWTANDFPEIAGWLTANEKPLAEFVEAVQRPHYFNPMLCRRFPKTRGLLFGARLAGLQSCREVALALQARAMLRVAEGREDDAWKDLLACDRLGRLVGSGGSLPEALLGNAIDFAIASCDLAYLGRATLTARQIQDRLSDLRAMPDLNSVADKIETCERINLLDVLQHVRRDGPESLKGMGDDDEHRDSEPMIAIMAALDWGPALRNTNKWLDRAVAVLRIEGRGQREKELGHLHDDLFALKAKATDITNLPTGENIGNVVISLFMPGFQKVQAAQDRSTQVRRNLHVAFALAAYRADTDRYPAKLDDLVPKYLPSIPGDLFTGKPLIYRPTEAGYLFYSVGVNGKDDGGRFYDDDPPGDDLGVRMPLPPLKSKK